MQVKCEGCDEMVEQEDLEENGLCGICNGGEDYPAHDC